MGEGRVNRRVWGGAAVLLLLGMLAVAPAFACGGNRGNITVNPTVADAGTTVEVNGAQFQPAPAPDVMLRWGGSAAPALAVAPDENGNFRTRIAVPAGAQTGYHQLSATQTAPDGQYVAFSTVQVRGVQQAPVTQPAAVTTPGTTAAPAPASEPAAAQPAPAPAPAPAVAAAPVTGQAAAPRRSTTVVAGTPTPAPAGPSQQAVPAPAAVPPPPPSDGPKSESSEATPTPSTDTPIPALRQPDPAGLGRPSAEKSGSGTASWLVPLVGVGIALSVASCAAVVADVRRKRATAETASATTNEQ